MPHAGGRRRRLVVAGAEGGAVAGEDDGADRAVGIASSSARWISASRLCDSAFMALRPVERDGRDLVVDAVDQVR